jgi:hypothetical protein
MVFHREAWTWALWRMFGDDHKKWPRVDPVLREEYLREAERLQAQGDGKAYLNGGEFRPSGSRFGGATSYVFGPVAIGLSVVKKGARRTRFCTSGKPRSGAL